MNGNQAMEPGLILIVLIKSSHVCVLSGGDLKEKKLLSLSLTDTRRHMYTTC